MRDYDLSPIRNNDYDAVAAALVREISGDRAAMTLLEAGWALIHLRRVQRRIEREARLHDDGTSETMPSAPKDQPQPAREE